MLYIHNISCISPQKSFSEFDAENLVASDENKLKVIEPSYPGIPNNILRRMGKAVRISVGAALPIIQNNNSLNGIIIGTANGGMEDCIKFMNQIIQYEEGLLTPGNFVQSTPNGLAAQIALLQTNKGYNITHSHRGLSFENALIDAQLLLEEFPEHNYLVGAADEISSYNYNVEVLGGWFKKEAVSNLNLYEQNSQGSMAGEGAVMFIASSIKKTDSLCLKAIETLHSQDSKVVMEALKVFLKQHLPNSSVDIFITGENGDNRFTFFYESAEALMNEHTNILRFKHMSGESPTASSQALFIAYNIMIKNYAPQHMIKQKGASTSFKTCLIYNNYKGLQHSFMLLEI